MGLETLIAATIASTAVSAFGTYQSGRENAALLDYNAQVAQVNAQQQANAHEINAEILSRQASDVRQTTRDRVLQHMSKVRRIQASQKATLASRGLRVGSVSSEALLLDSFQQAEQDRRFMMREGSSQSAALSSQASRTRINAQQALNFGDAQASGLRFQAGQARTSASFGAFGTVLGGAGDVARTRLQFG